MVVVARQASCQTAAVSLACVGMVLARFAYDAALLDLDRAEGLPSPGLRPCRQFALLAAFFLLGRRLNFPRILLGVGHMNVLKPPAQTCALATS